MTIKILTGFTIGALAVAGSAFAAVEWIGSPASARLHPCESAESGGVLVVVVPRLEGRFPVGGASPALRPPQVVVLTPRGSPAAD
ncbi:MAG TPA: hypothetical protein VMH26_07500 [Burkholderiales bacterium]|nr:hypothetical protein [Burkholderiales bacterium]